MVWCVCVWCVVCVVCGVCGVWCGVWCVVVVRTFSLYDVSVHATMQLIRVAGHLGVRLKATPPPRALDDEELFVIEGSQKLLCTVP